MLKIYATQDTSRGGSYVEISERVGYFPVNPDIPPYVPQRVSLVVDGLLRHTDVTEAWVSHDGSGNVDGFPIGKGWEEECENPSGYFYPPEEYQYEPPESCEAYVPL